MKRKTLHTSIRERLRYQILSGEWPSGTNLPPERKLAEAYGVSRNTVVNAYSDLESEGLIESKVGSGRFVKPVPPDDNSFDWKRELMEHRPRYAPSALTKLHTTAGEKSMFNFAFGEGGKHALKRTDFAKAFDVERILGTLQSDYMMPIVGHPELRTWISEWTEDVFSVRPDDVMITSGSQEALYLCANILTRPGDSVAVEMPTYFGALQVFQTLGLHTIPVPMDHHGLRVEVLEGILKRTRPRFIYVNPTFQNPTGTVLSMQRRERLLYLSEKYDIPIIEDDAYRYLYFEQEPPAPLKTLDLRGNVIYINTFSKLLFPGLRLGWVTANRPFIDILTRRKELSVTTNTFVQQALLMFLETGTFNTHLRRVRTLYSKQAKVMESCLNPLRSRGIVYTPPTGGFYIWVGLPNGINAADIVRTSIEQGVLFANGDLFMTREVSQPYIRLSYSYETEDRIKAGMHIITSLIESL